MFEVIDKWEDDDTVSDHGQSVPLFRSIPNVQKTGHPIPIPQNEWWPVTITIKYKASSVRP